MSTGLPRIDSPYPREVEAQPAKDFPHLRICALKTIMHDDLTDSCHVLLRNYNADTQELSPDPSDIFTFTVHNLFHEADRVPLLAQAMGLIITCTGLMYHEDELVKQIEEAELKGEPTAELEAQLVAIRQQLGIAE